jgi:hypothetical protein
MVIPYVTSHSKEAGNMKKEKSETLLAGNQESSQVVN